jgi:hypothetical protein
VVDRSQIAASDFEDRIRSFVEKDELLSEVVDRRLS